MHNSQNSQHSSTILGYVPALVVQHLLHLKQNKISRCLPEKQTVKSVVMFADISGFTALTEALSKIGQEGAEVIAFAINRYMELLVQGIGRSGGDIFKFAGDAMIVIWPPPQDNFEEKLELLCKQSLQSALDLQNKLNNTDIFENIKLSVKIGFGVGEMNIIHVGGIFARTEYLATGDPLIQAFSAEHCCTSGGQTMISQAVYDIIGDVFECQKVKDHHGFYQVHYLKENQVKVRMKADALLIKNNITASKFAMIKNEIQSYIPAALIPYIELNEEQWSAEIRRLTIMFVNLSIDLSDAKTEQGLQQIQRVIQTVQKCIYMHEGSLNKLLMDDKGSTLIVVFGLPPLSHQNDPIRAILTAQLMLDELPRIQCQCSVGIATGVVFAGVVGTSGSRREYSVLGDSVNLAARLMQTACGEKQNKILCCQETAKSALNKIGMKFLRSVLMKGKIIETHIYIPTIELKNQMNLFPQFRTHNFTQKQQEFNTLQIFGRDNQQKKINNALDKVIKGIDKKKIILVKGTYGVGKSILIKKVIHRLQEKINSNQYSAWKYGELPQIFTSQLGPINKQYRLNGLREILKQIFLAFSERVERPPDLELFSMMIQQEQFPDHAVSQLKQILDLEDMRNIEKFPQGKLDENLFELRRIVLQFMSNFFEQIPDKLKELYRSPADLGWETKSDRKPNMKYSMKNCHIICPVILVLDDMQCYDEISYKIINQMIKTYDRLAVIAIIRDSFPELGLPSKQMEKKASQDDVLLQGLSMLEDVLDPCDSVTINLRGLEKKGKEDDFSKMVKFSFNISRLVHYQQSEALRKREMTFIGDVQVQENLMNHFFLYHQNKAKLAEQDPELLFFQYIYLKTAGNPLMTLNFIQNLIDQKLLILGQKAVITEELLELISSEESIIVNAPSDRVEVNGPIIDRLSCLEQLILKCASAIGDIFDLQSLHKINPFKVAVHQRLQKMMEELETKEIIEVMETQEFNVYYRFVHPFFRECLYQRIIYKQRRQLHLAVAEAIQMLPSVIENDEIQESRRLQFHWNMSEQKWKLDDNQEPEMQKSTTNLLRQLTQKVSNTTTNSQKFTQAQPPSNENMSSKAMRSIILNQIQNKLAKNKNHSNTILQDGILEKKSNTNVTWAQRYCVLDGKEFRFYYTSNHAARGEQPLSSIPLKSLYNVIALFGRDKSGRDNVLQICSTSWFKKSKEMNDRKFLFNARNEAELEKWVIYLEFSKAKAVYEDFTNQYGKITFPIGNALDAYDQQYRQDLNEKQKMGAAANNTPKGRNSILSRNSRVSKFTLATKQFKFNMTQSSVDEAQQNSQYIDAVATKERMSAFVQKGLLLLFSHLFDMSIQKQDEYKPFGQSNLVMKKMTHIFKIDKSLLTDQRKSSAIGTDKQLLSPIHTEQQHRKPLNLESFGIAVKRLSHDSDSLSESVSSKQHLAQIKEADEEEPIEEVVEENQSIQLSESTLLKQKFLKQQRLQNQKFSFGDDSFTKNDIRISPIQSVNQGKSGSRGSQESFQEELKQSLTKPNRRNTDQAVIHEMQQTNYFNQSNMVTHKQDMVLEDFPKISQNEQSDTPVLKQAPEHKEPIQVQVNLTKQPEEVKKLSRRMSKSPLSSQKESLTIRPISSKNLNQLPIVEEIPKKTETRRPSKSPSNQRQSKDLTQQKIPSQKALNKSVSKSSVKSDMSVDEPTTTHQELNQNIIQLLERLSKVESPTQQFLTPIQQLELQKRDTITQYGTRYSNISQQPTRYKYNYMPNHSSQSQKTLQMQYSSAQLVSQPPSIYGTALNTCKSLSGDTFKLNPGTRIVVMKVDHEKRLVQVSYQNQIGLFHLKDIAVLEEQFLEAPLEVVNNPSSVQQKYQSMLQERFNTSQSPNYRKSTPSRSKTPTKIISKNIYI